MNVSFFVHGNPQTAGSRSFYGFTKSGKAIMAPANKQQKSWQELVRIEAQLALPLAWKFPIAGPVTLATLWVLPRPKNHYRTGKYCGTLRKDAPSICAVKPDEDKLQRALRDALTKIVWQDDAQVVCCFSCKSYVLVEDGCESMPGVHVRVSQYRLIDGEYVDFALDGWQQP